MSSSDKVRFHTHLAAEEAAHHLEDLAHGLRSGAIQVESDDEALDIDCAASVRLSLHAEMDQHKRKSRVTVALSWRLPDAPPAASQLRISARDGASIPEAFENDASRAPRTHTDGGRGVARAKARHERD